MTDGTEELRSGIWMGLREPDRIVGTEKPRGKSGRGVYTMLGHKPGRIWTEPRAPERKTK